MPHLPGTTVAGSLKAHCASHPQLATLFGGDPDSETRTPSRIQVLGTRLRGGPDLTRQTRVAIDRHRGAATAHFLFIVEQLPAGTEFDIYLRCDDLHNLVPDLHAALQTWQPRLGRGTSTGAGACTVTGIGATTLDLATVDGLAAWLDITGPDTYPQPDTAPPIPAQPEPLVDLTLRIIDGIHIGTGEPALSPDGRTNISSVQLDTDRQPYIPGSSLKGVLRSRVEYICRVLGQLVCTQANCGACRPCALFGWSPAASDQRMGGRAAIVVHTAPIRDAQIEHRNHVALDRVTGGQHDALLFTDLVVVAGQFQLRIDQRDQPDPAAIALLQASIADLHDGLVGIGASTTRGLGTVRVTSPHWQPPDLTNLDTLLTGTQP